MQLRPVLEQRVVGIDQRHCSTNSDVVRKVFDAPQLLNFGHVDDVLELQVLLGHPQTHIGTPGDQLRGRMRRAQPQQPGQRPR